MTFEHDDFDGFPTTIEASDGGPAPSRFHLLGADDLRGLPELEWAVRHVLPAVGVATIYGPSGSGKSFLALDLARCLAEAGTFFGHGVSRQHRVVVIALEGEVGVRRRVQAIEKATGRPFTKNVRFIFDAVNLLEGGDLVELHAAIAADGGADTVVIDTLNRAMPGADENSARDASCVIAALGWLQSALACLVIALHHCGKDESRGMRGHSSMHAAMDAVISVNRVAGLREWTLVKSKDDIEGASHAFTLESVELGQDAMGDPITSAVVCSVDTPVDRAPRPPSGGNQRIIYMALGDLFRDSKVLGKPGAPPTRPCLQLDQAIEATKVRLAVEPKRQAERARLAINNMVATGVLGCSDGWIWLI